MNLDAYSSCAIHFKIEIQHRKQANSTTTELKSKQNENENERENEYKLFKWLLTMKTLFILRWDERKIPDHPPFLPCDCYSPAQCTVDGEFVFVCQ